jgi:hypothetical protein
MGYCTYTIKFLMGYKNCLFPELLYLINHKRTSPHAFPSALCPSFGFLGYSTSFLENLYHHVHKRDGCKRKLITKLKINYFAPSPERIS